MQESRGKVSFINGVGILIKVARQGCHSVSQSVAPFFSSILIPAGGLIIVIISSKNQLKSFKNKYKFLDNIMYILQYVNNIMLGICKDFLPW